MAEKRISLDVIGVAEPCHEDWSGMTGGEQKKFCDSCAKHVHNLSEMTRDQAERFVTDNPTGVCIRFHRDAQTGKMLTADDRCATDPVSKPTPGRGRFSGPVPLRTNTSRRRAYRLAGNAYVPFLAVFSLLAGVVAVILNGGRAPATQTTCTMGEAAPPPTHQPRMGSVAVPPGHTDTPQTPDHPDTEVPPTPPVVEPVPQIMGIIAAPQPDPPVDPPVIEPGIVPAPQPIMGRIAPNRPQPPLPNPPQPEPIPAPQPAPPEIMGEIEMIMGDIVCPDEPAEVVEPINPPRPGGNAAQN